MHSEFFQNYFVPLLLSIPLSIYFVFYTFGKKIVRIWVQKKLFKVNFTATETYVSGDLKWALNYDASKKRIALFNIFKSRVDFYNISLVKKSELEIFEGKTKKRISLPNTLLGALTGRLIGGKNAMAIISGATIGMALSPNIINEPKIFIKNIYLDIFTSNNIYRINFKPLGEINTNDYSVAEAIKWNKFFNNLP